MVILRFIIQNNAVHCSFIPDNTVILYPFYFTAYMSNIISMIVI